MHLRATHLVLAALAWVAVLGGVPAPFRSAAAAGPESDAAVDARAAVVRIDSDACGSPRTTGTGTTVRIDGRSFVLTAAHVVAGSTRRGISGDDGAVAAGPPSISPDRDLALLPVGLATGAVVATESLAPGTSVTLYGHPLGGPLRTRTATIAFHRSGRVHGLGGDVYVLDVGAPLEGGWSGGPVLDHAGALVAVLDATDAVTGMAIAIDVAGLDPGDVTAPADMHPCR